jgi:hypothetical protein
VALTPVEINMSMSAPAPPEWKNSTSNCKNANVKFTIGYVTLETYCN